MSSPENAIGSNVDPSEEPGNPVVDPSEDDGTAQNSSPDDPEAQLAGDGPNRTGDSPNQMADGPNQGN